MKYSERLKNLWKATSVEESRYTPRAVQIDAEKKIAVATDGHMLSIVDVKDLLDPEEKTFLLPVDALKAARLLYLEEKKKHPRGRVSEMRPVKIQKTDDSVTVVVGSSKRGQSFDLMNGVYPAWDKVIPDAKGYETSITFSIGLLCKLAESMRGDFKMEDTVSLSVKTKDHPVLVTVNGNSPSYGILVPMRTKHHAPKMFWEPSPAPTTPPPTRSSDAQE
jgi:DNA polymerase III sliding clamp (beta) subunit (PCNA family)